MMKWKMLYLVMEGTKSEWASAYPA
jgi:hypothetical protein